jgi:hypothetical protein
MDKNKIRVISLKDHDQDQEDLVYWLSRPIEERIAAVELLRTQMYPNETPPRLQRVYRRSPI